jgi:hypothetical protein
VFAIVLVAEPFVWNVSCLSEAVFAGAGGMTVASVAVVMCSVMAVIGHRRRRALALRRWPLYVPLAMLGLLPLVLYLGTRRCTADPDVLRWGWLWFVAEIACGTTVALLYASRGMLARDGGDVVDVE